MSNRPTYEELEQRVQELEQAADVIWVLDPESQFFKYVSPSVEGILSFTQNECINRSLAETVTPNSLEYINRTTPKRIEQMLQGDVRHYTDEIEVIHKDGHIVPTEINMHFLKNQSAGAIEGTGVMREITMRKQALKRAASLNRLNEKLLQVGNLDQKLKSITDAIIQTFKADFARIWMIKHGDLCNSECPHADVDEGPHICRYRKRCLHLMASSGRYTHMDGGHRRVPFGCYKIGRVAAEDDPKFLTNDVVNDPRIHDHEWAQRHGLVSFAGYRLLSSDSRVVGVLALFSKRPISSEEDAQIESLAGTTAYIIQAAKADEALRISEKKYRLIIENQTDLVFQVDNEGRFQFVSPSYCKLFRVKESDLLGKTFMPLVHEDDQEVTAKAMEKRYRPPYTTYIEQRVMTKDGWRWIGWLDTSVRDKNGNVVGMVGVGRDIDDRKKAEIDKERLQTQLLKSQKMESIGNLAGGIAHDFNNILSSIIGFTELALDDTQKGSALEDSLLEVYTAGKRAKDLVKQILAFARQSEEKVGPIQPSMIAREVLKLIRSTIPTTIEIQQKIESEATILGNATQLHQVLMNLCTNAAHAMDDTGGVLFMSLKDLVIDKENLPIGMRKGDYVEIKVLDNGIGIAPEIIESIFEPYFTTKGPGEGTGLGLAMVQGVIESYGGKITVDSQLGKGTTFKISLPVIKKRSGHVAYLPEQLPGGTEHILLVDDEYPIVKMGSRILERLGYSVTARTSSVEALDLFNVKPNDFDLIITDMTMPNLTGDDLAIELMKIRPDIPVILCTGYSKKISDEIALEIGIKGFAYKPVVKADLAKTVRKVLDKAKEEN